MATDTEVLRLTEAYRAAQARKAAAMAALVAIYYRQKVDSEDPTSIQRWLDIMIPRILRESDANARLAIAYARALRQMEVPDAAPFVYRATKGANAEQVERSLRVVGPEAYQRKMTEIRRLPDLQYDAADKTAMIADANKAAETKIAGAVARHVQNGGRQTILDGIRDDPDAIGFIRVTKKDPCFFCAALASRGIVYGEDSFDASDARFTGDGTAKVHDSCGCGIKPVYTPQDALLVNTANFEALWFEYASGPNPMLHFRQAYEGRKVTA